MKRNIIPTYLKKCLPANYNPVFEIISNESFTFLWRNFETFFFVSVSFMLDVMGCN